MSQIRHGQLDHLGPVLDQRREQLAPCPAVAPEVGDGGFEVAPSQSGDSAVEWVGVGDGRGEQVDAVRGEIERAKER